MISGNQSQFITRKRGGCFGCFYLKFLWIFARAHSHKYMPDVCACHHCETSTALLNKRKCGIVIWFVGVFSKCVKLRKASGRETCLSQYRHRHAHKRLYAVLSGRSKGRRPQHMPPILPKFFSISCSFLENFGKIVCWHPLLWGILHPPLVLPLYSKIQVLPGITSCRLMKDNKQQVDLTCILRMTWPKDAIDK